MYDNYSLYSGMENEFSVYRKRCRDFVFLFKADICTLIGLKSEKKIKKIKQKINKNRNKTKLSAACRFL